MFVSSARYEELRRLTQRQSAIIADLAGRLGIDPTTLDPIGQVDDTERALIADGKKIYAIKHHRERTGSGLKEAKDTVDRVAREMRGL